MKHLSCHSLYGQKKVLLMMPRNQGVKSFLDYIVWRCETPLSFEMKVTRPPVGRDHQTLDKKPSVDGGQITPRENTYHCAASAEEFN